MKAVMFPSELSSGSKAFSPQRWFQEAEKTLDFLLAPGVEMDKQVNEELDDPDIIFLGNSLLKPENFSLRGVDYQAIGPLLYPGKSLMFDFLNIRGSSMALTAAARDIITQRTYGKSSDRRDSVYVASIPAINAAGYKVYYAPVKGNELHLRLVWGGHLRFDYPVLGDLPEIPENARKAIASVWTKATVISKI